MHIHFSGETDFFSVKMELISYLDAMNAPNQISKDAEALNEARRRVKSTQAARKKAADDAKTEELKRDAYIESLGRAG